MTAKDKLIKARTALVLDEPFFGALALRLTLKEDPLCKTLWTDGSSLGFNPDFVESLSMDSLKGCVCHEIMHCVLAHHTRRDNREKGKWNVAADYTVNDIIRKDFSLPEGHLFNPEFSGLSVEQVYSKLPDESKPDEKGSQAKDGAKGKGDSDPGGCGEIRDASPSAGSKVSSEADLARSEAKWKVATAQAVQQAKAFGKLPAGLDRCVEEIINPKVGWHSILQQFMDTVVKSDYSWVHPNRRHIHAGVYLPSCRNLEMGTIVLAVDTSGSVSKKALEQVAAELSGILDVVKTDCHVVYCDSEIQNTEYFKSGDLILKLDAKGGGGTNFEPVFEWIEEEGIRPACLLYFTDLAGSFPEDEADYPVLWVTDRHFHESPPFGEVLEVIGD